MMNVCWAKCREVIDDRGRRIMPVELERYRVRGQVRNLSEGGRRTDPVSAIFWRGSDIYFVSWSDIPKKYRVSDEDAQAAADENARLGYEDALAQHQKELDEYALMDHEEVSPPEPPPEPESMDCSKARERWEDEPRPIVPLMVNAVVNWTGLQAASATMFAADENYITGSITMNDGVVITIEPGCLVRAGSSNAAWTIGLGTVVAVGAPNAWIGFVVEDGTNKYFRFDWDGIAGTSGPSSFEYVFFVRSTSPNLGPFNFNGAGGSDYSGCIVRNILVDSTSMGEAGSFLIRARHPIQLFVSDIVILGAGATAPIETASGDSTGSFVNVSRLILTNRGRRPSDILPNLHNCYIRSDLSDAIILGSRVPSPVTGTNPGPWTYEDCYFFGVNMTSLGIISNKNPGDVTFNRCLVHGARFAGLALTAFTSGAGDGPNVTIQNTDVIFAGGLGFSAGVNCIYPSSLGEIYLQDCNNYHEIDTPALNNQWTIAGTSDFTSPPTLRVTPHLPVTVVDGLGGAAGTLNVAVVDAHTISVQCEAETGSGGAKAKLVYEVHWRKVGDTVWQRKRIGGNLTVPWFGAYTSIVRDQSSLDNPEEGVMATSLDTTIDNLSPGTDYEIRVQSYFNKAYAPTLVEMSNTYTLTTPGGGGGGGAPLVGGGSGSLVRSS